MYILTAMKALISYLICLLTVPISARANLAAPENDAQLKSQYEQLMFVQKDLESQKYQVTKTQQELKVQREQVNKTRFYIFSIYLAEFVSRSKHSYFWYRLTHQLILSFYFMRPAAQISAKSYSSLLNVQMY